MDFIQRLSNDCRLLFLNPKAIRDRVAGIHFSKTCQRTRGETFTSTAVRASRIRPNTICFPPGPTVCRTRRTTIGANNSKSFREERERGLKIDNDYSSALGGGVRGMGVYCDFCGFRSMTPRTCGVGTGPL